jgi:5-deoxy-5-amino-3-dehydroquinate synthase
LPDGADADALLTLMARDKKAVDGLTFVLDGPRGVDVVHGVDPDQVRLALETVR